VLSLTDSSDISQFFKFDHSFVFYMIFLLDDDYRVKIVLWHDLAHETQKYYEIAIDFFQIWCMFNNQTFWSITLKNVEKWVVNKMYDSTLNKQEKIKIVTIQSYLSDIRSYHVDHLFDLNVFDHSRLQKMLREEKRMFLTIKITRLLITKDILQLITRDHLTNINEINLNVVFKIEWAKFLRLKEIIYIAKNFTKLIFSITKITRFDISFAKND
jgi:hypothetical protein